MLRYTPEFLAVLRHRYEQTQQSERSIARDFGVAGSTVRRIARMKGWVRPPPAMRDLEPAMRLLEQARALKWQVHGQNFDDFEAALPIPVARYTPDLIAALRRRYEQTEQSTRSIADELGVTERTLRRIASKNGWVRPSPKWRDLEPAARLLEEVTALERRVFESRRK